MAFFFDVNGAIPATGAAHLFRMKALLVTAGWVVKSSGTGVAGGAFSSSGDIITQAGTGAGGMANVNSWYRIQQPGVNGREFTFQEAGDGTTYSARWKYSGGPGTGFTGGSPSATQTPSASDEQIILGGGTDAAPSYGFFIDSPEANQRFNMVAGDTASNYVFLWWSNISGTASARTALYLDVMLSGTFPAADQDPAVVYWDSFTSNLLNQDLNNLGGGLKGWLKKNLVGAGYVNMSALWYRSAGNFVFPGSGGQNPHTSKDDLAPVPYGRDSGQAAPFGYKGISSFLLWDSVSRAYGDTLNIVSSKDYLIIGAAGGNWLAVPWNGSDLII